MYNLVCFVDSQIIDSTYTHACTDMQGTSMSYNKPKSATWLQQAKKCYIHHVRARNGIPNKYFKNDSDLINVSNYVFARV